jgi:hypothetical protein
VLQENDAAWREFINHTDTLAVQKTTEMVADRTRDFMPIANAARYPRPGRTGRNPTGASWPPGAMRRSINTDYDLILGDPKGYVFISFIYGIAVQKLRHGIRPALRQALASVQGTEIS